MKRPFMLLLFVLSLLVSACGGAKLPFPEEATSNAIMQLAAAQDAGDSEVADELLVLNDVLMNVYAGEYVPIPVDEMIPFVPARAGSYTGADAFRWGYGLPEDPTNENNTGAFVARPMSVGYSTMLPLTMDVNRAEILQSIYRTSDRVFSDGAVAAFLSGGIDLTTSADHSVILAPKGIVFEYDSHTTVRRIRDARLLGGEAVISWELMDGEAVRIEGGYNAALSFLKNVNILLPLSEKLSFWIMASWSETGGSLFVFSASGTSGDIADGMRKDYADWEEYFAAQGLTCLPDACDPPL